MADKDDFSEGTKRFMAARSIYCSFPGCSQGTVGPSDESPIAVTNVGEAAHICEARPGSRRYVASMKSKERAHMSNAIWLCVTHARLIDRDDVTYTIDSLRQMKRDHESLCAEKLRKSSVASGGTEDLIALGPDVVYIGTLVAAELSNWSLHLTTFIRGDMHPGISFIERFPVCPVEDSYVLLDELGDRRLLTAPPSLYKDDTGFLISDAVPDSSKLSQDQGSQSWE